MDVGFGELFGELRQGAVAGSAPPGPLVVLSSISHGASAGPKWPGLTIRYVGRGTEHYTIGGRHYRVGEDQLMLAPQIHGSEVEVRRSERERTLGLCIFLPELGDGVEQLIDCPVLLPASCELGAALKRSLARLSLPVRSAEEPRRIASETRARLGATLLALEAQMESVAGRKRSTRLEAVRRMNLARAYLHHVTDRPVPLEELAREIAVSPFQLLRNFRDCFGETPAAYHRRLRLTLACQAAEQQSQSYAFVADRFGFAGGASFSHAHKRAFGAPPVRTLGSRRAN